MQANKIMEAIIIGCKEENSLNDNADDVSFW